MLRADDSVIRRKAEKKGLSLVDALVRALQSGNNKATALASCPNSEAVVKAAVRSAKKAEAPVFFAATLNQVDLDRGYTGWTPAEFVALVREESKRVGYEGPIAVGLDHGGPWLKDIQAQEKWPLERAMEGIRESIAACLDAGYDLLHIDPTVDRTMPRGEPMPIEIVIGRTLELMHFAESHRRRAGLSAVSYEVGTEEVHGGLADMSTFERFLDGLKEGLERFGLHEVWPSFVVGKVGTDLHTTEFDPEVARRLVEAAGRYGSTIKGHYTDYVSNPEAYREVGMGGANVGPEFTEVEYESLGRLEEKEKELIKEGRLAAGSRMMEALREAVLVSGRWEKWLQKDEEGKRFEELTPERQGWLVRTGCRYIWAAPSVKAAREKLYANLSGMGEPAEDVVLGAIEEVMWKYYHAFGLVGSLEWVESKI